MRLRNFCSANHCFTHANAASSSFTVIDNVVWPTNQYQSRLGIARKYAPRAPMIMSSNPPEANWFWPPSTCFRNSSICIYKLFRNDDFRFVLLLRLLFLFYFCESDLAIHVFGANDPRDLFHV